MNRIQSIFLKNRNENGIPILNEGQWKELNDEFDKETIISELIEYISIYRPACPLRNLTLEDAKDAFWKLTIDDLKNTVLKHDVIKDRVLEKFEDYGRPYKDYGLGVVQMGAQYNDVSNFFHQDLRYKCDVWGFRSPIYRWNNNDDLRSIFLALWRLDNKELSINSYITSFRLGAYIATQFKPQVAKLFYNITKSKTVFDSSCGWGDRLAGFYCSNATEYYGTDPNEQTFERYFQQCIKYEGFLGSEPSIKKTDDYFIVEGEKRVEIHRKPAEDFDYSILPEIDCAFTSPPYFATEKYNSDGKFVQDQSWSRYSTYEEWRDGFYFPVNEKTFEKLSPTGYQFVNIMDPKIKSKRYYASDELIDMMERIDAHFCGQIGMRIMQRPKNIPKEKLQEFMDKIYVEPVWIFSKQKKDFTLVDDYLNQGKLDNFFA